MVASSPSESMERPMFSQVTKIRKSSDGLVQETISIFRSQVYQNAMNCRKDINCKRILPGIHSDEEALEWLIALQTSNYLTVVKEGTQCTSLPTPFQPLEMYSYFSWTDGKCKTPHVGRPTWAIIATLSLLAVFVLRNDLRDLPWIIHLYSRSLATDFKTTAFQASVFDI